MGLEIYRGESKEYEVPSEPSLFRKHRKGQYGSFVPLAYLECEMLSEFQRQAYSSFKTAEIVPTNELEWRALAQHYGLPTRLIDWTTNPMAALYFAVEKHDDEDGYLYFHSNIELVEYDVADTITFDKGRMLVSGDQYKPFQFTILEDVPFEINEDTIYHEPIIFYRPKYTDSRYSNQNTVLACPDGPSVDFAKLSRESIRIPHIIKPLLRSFLRKIGIDSSFIYPGLSGIATQVNQSITDRYMSNKLVEKYNLRTLFY